MEGKCEEHGQDDGQVAVEVEPPWPDTFVEVEETKPACNDHQKVFPKVKPQKIVLLGKVITDRVGIRVGKGKYKPDVGQAVNKPG